ncbi:chloride channel protein [Aggregicoccus sp. 17bor-14]|nr:MULTISPECIES: chloride channel protein [Myxococcaceae]MBF5041582.1 chloride channel protein [Simulacricoccus sp. 17bor-14]MRI87368.1 chloride channel protein [Aggregicoccus sp. 17bor-14]
MQPTLDTVPAPMPGSNVGGRTVFISVLSIGLALLASVVAVVLTHLIAFVTHLAFYGELSAEPVTPWNHHLGLWVIAVPVVGALIVGVMARYGSAAIRGHGIPEAMEQVLYNHSRIPPKMTWLKPLSAAVAIGTGGPFGAEGPIIATGGALGSFLGQLLRITADERKTLLAAGAAAGMSATFGSPVAAVVLAIELLLFEYRGRSLIPVALATATAAAARIAMEGSAPAFPMPTLPTPTPTAIAFYILLGAVIGVVSVVATRAVYAIEDAFEKLPLHWMWWPALGAVAVGVVGYFSPRTLGVGYSNITDILGGQLVGWSMLAFVLLKFVSWSIALGSGTSGGTLAPLFTVGSGVGSALAAGAIALVPGLSVDVRLAALVGMAAIFAGASRALLASVVFAFETTRQTVGLLPLLGGCAASYLVSCLLMRHSIMTEKMARRGARVPSEYAPDFLAGELVREHARRTLVTLAAEAPLAEVAPKVLSALPPYQHQGYPVVSAEGRLVGVLTRRDFLAVKEGPAADGLTVGSLVKRAPSVVFDDRSMRDAADQMVREGVGRLPVVSAEDPQKLVGILTRSDLLSAHHRRLHAEFQPEQGLGRGRAPAAPAH